MSNARINIQWQHKTACLLMAAMLWSCAAGAQLSLKRQKYDSIAARYQGEHAVYTDVIHKLVIKEEGGVLTANSTIERDKLLISERSLNRGFNFDPLYGGYFSEVTFYDGVSYIPERNDYKRIRNYYNADGGFYFTGLSKKSITHTTYDQWHRDIRLLPPFNFSDDIPTVNSVFEVTAPKYVKMTFLLKGVDTSRIKRTVEQKGGNVVYTFTGTNLPADKHYSNVPKESYYVAHVIPSIVSFRFTGAKKDSILTGTVEDHYKFQYAYIKGINVRTDSFLNKKTAEVIRGAYSDRDKAMRIYDYVQKNMHYLCFDYGMDGLIPRQADTVYKRMYGDCKDMTSIIVAMCRKAGVSAYYTVIGTNRKPYTHDEIQSEYVYDHMIAAIKLDGEWVFLDGTTHVMPFGANREDLQGKEALIMIDATHSKVVKIPEASASRNVITDNTTLNISYNDVSGNTSKHFSGYPAWEISEDLALKKRTDERDDYVRSLALRGNNNFVIKSYNIDPSDAGEKDVNLNLRFEISGYVQRVKRDYFVNMNLNRTFSDMRMNDEDRTVPAYLDYKHKVKETVTLNIPKGFRVSYVPKAAKGGVDGLWSYNIAYTVDRKNNTVTLNKEFELNTMKIDPSQFAATNKLADQLKQLYKETVVLTAK